MFENEKSENCLKSFFFDLRNGERFSFVQRHMIFVQNYSNSNICYNGLFTCIYVLTFCIYFLYKTIYSTVAYLICAIGILSCTISYCSCQIASSKYTGGC